MVDDDDNDDGDVDDDGDDDDSSVEKGWYGLELECSFVLPVPPTH